MKSFPTSFFFPSYCRSQLHSSSACARSTTTALSRPTKPHRELPLPFIFSTRQPLQTATASTFNDPACSPMCHGRGHLPPPSSVFRLATDPSLPPPSNCREFVAVKPEIPRRTDDPPPPEPSHHVVEDLPPPRTAGATHRTSPQIPPRSFPTSDHCSDLLPPPSPCSRPSALLPLLLQPALNVLESRPQSPMSRSSHYRPPVPPPSLSSAASIRQDLPCHDRQHPSVAVLDMSSSSFGEFSVVRTLLYRTTVPRWADIVVGPYLPSSPTLRRSIALPFPILVLYILSGVGHLDSFVFCICLVFCMSSFDRGSMPR